ncbi:MAG: O-antigen ligase family protein [Phycisphaerae bacterium]|nr:O-antigen ligase family protein [Phycisphaerae bacterium]
MLGIRAILIAVVGLSASGASLFRPYWGMLMLAVLYFFRPDLYGAEEYVTPVKWLTISVLLGYLFTGLSTRKGRSTGILPVSRTGVSPMQSGLENNVLESARAVTSSRRRVPANRNHGRDARGTHGQDARATPEGVFAGTGWMMVILGVYVVSSIFAPMTDAVSWSRLWLIVKIFIAVFLIQKVCDTPARLAGFVAAMLLGSCWFLKVTVVGWAAYGWGDVRIDAAAGQGGGANYIAWVLAAMTGFVLYKVVRGRGWQRWTAVVLVPLFVVGNMATGSRGGLLCLVAAGVTFVLMMRRKLWLLLPAGAIGVWLLVSLAPASYMNRMATITSDPAKMDASSLTRYQNVQIGKRIIADYPVFGTGLETFPRAKRAYLTPEYVGGMYHVAHNTLIQLGSECGVPMLMAFAGVTGLATWRLLRRRPIADAVADDHMEWLRIGTLCALAATWAEMIKGDVAHMDVFWWFYGLAFAYHRVSRRWASGGGGRRSTGILPVRRMGVSSMQSGLGNGALKLA